MPKTETLYKTKAQNYCAQLQFLNQRILHLVETIQSQSNGQALILLQSDEGPLPLRYEQNEKTFRWKTATKAELQEKFGILNALYLPGIEKKELSPHLSPVNNFRLVFQHYFSAPFPLLPDESFAFESEAQIYHFFSVTEKVKEQ